jgi:hypothetical protein
MIVLGVICLILGLVLGVGHPVDDRDHPDRRRNHPLGAGDDGSSRRSSKALLVSLPRLFDEPVPTAGPARLFSSSKSSKGRCRPTSSLHRRGKRRRERAERARC